MPGVRAQYPHHAPLLREACCSVLGGSASDPANIFGGCPAPAHVMAHVPLGIVRVKPCRACAASPASLGALAPMTSAPLDVAMATAPASSRGGADVEVDLVPQKGMVRLQQDPKTLRFYLVSSYTQEAIGLPFVGNFKHELLFDESGFGFVDFDQRSEGRGQPIWLSEVLRLQVYEGSGGDRFIVERSGPRLTNEVVHRVPEFFRSCVVFEVSFSFGVPAAERKMPLAHFPHSRCGSRWFWQQEAINKVCGLAASDAPGRWFQRYALKWEKLAESLGIAGGLVRSIPNPQHEGDELDGKGDRVLRFNSMCTPLLMILLARWCFTAARGRGRLKKVSEVQAVRALLQFMTQQACLVGLLVILYLDPAATLCPHGFFDGANPVAVDISSEGVMDLRPLHAAVSQAPATGTRTQKSFMKALNKLLSDGVGPSHTGGRLSQIPVVLMVACVCGPGCHPHRCFESPC